MRRETADPRAWRTADPDEGAEETENDPAHPFVVPPGDEEVRRNGGAPSLDFYQQIASCSPISQYAWDLGLLWVSDEEVGLIWSFDHEQFS